MPLVTFLIFLPAVGALVLLFLRNDRKEPLWIVSTATTGVALLLAVYAWAVFSPSVSGETELYLSSEGFDFVERVPWVAAWNLHYQVGLDGTSLLLVVLTNLLMFVSVLSSFTYITKRDKEYYVFLLLLQTGVVGTFSALDLILFYVFWEVMLVPLYFLIGIWGSQDRIYAAIKFFLFTLVGSVLMLIGILWLYFHCGTFDVLAIPGALRARPLSASAEMWLFVSLLVAFAIKVPMWPVHTWLPDAHTEAPTAGSVILAGVLLKTGVYGIVRFCIPFFPQAAVSVQWVVQLLSVIAIIYGACVVIGLLVGAPERADVKRMIAYSSVSHMGFCTLGLFAFNASGTQGALLQMINHGLSTGALFLLVGILYERRHTRLLGEYGGLAAVMPVYATLFMIAVLASVGLPLLNGFVSEFLILLGAFGANRPFAVLGATGVVLGAVYLLWIYQAVFFGKVTNPKNEALPDCSLREGATLVPLLAVCFWIGIYPASFLRPLEPTSRALVQVVGRTWQDTLFDLIPAAGAHSDPVDIAHPPEGKTVPASGAH